MTFRYGSLASWLNILCSLAAFAVGLLILTRGGSAGAEAITAGAAWLWLSEGLKLLIGLCIVVQASALYRLIPDVRMRWIGLMAALLMGIAGLLGMGALLWPNLRGLAGYVNPIALLSVVASGLWALSASLASRKSQVFPLWMKCVGCLLPLPGLVAFVVPAAAFGAFIGGLLWNLGIGLKLMSGHGEE